MAWQAARHTWVPPEALPDDPVDVREERPVLKGGQAVAPDDAVDLGLAPPEHVWVDGSGEEEGLDGGDGLVVHHGVRDSETTVSDYGTDRVCASCTVSDDVSE